MKRTRPQRSGSRRVASRLISSRRITSRPVASRQRNIRKTVPSATRASHSDPLNKEDQSDCGLSRHVKSRRVTSCLVGASQDSLSQRKVSFMHGIPTFYKGVRFRSMAEARWACFFDSLKLPWFFECDERPGYLPDFLIGGELLAEVKGDCHKVADLHKHVAKITESGWKGPWVLLGSHHTLQLGQRIAVPENADALWAEACNVTQWHPVSQRPIAYASQIPGFDPSQFQCEALQSVLIVPLQKPILPKVMTYKLQASPRTVPTLPRLPSG